MSGSFARTGLPGAVSTATYDAANELTQWNSAAISYDANGNMLTDGSNIFTWNARNQVATLNNVALQCDVFGRRITNAAGTSFLYDGANAAQELSGSTVSANLLSGGIDQVFSRTDSSGALAPLKDALGSTIALVDASGNVQTSYTYDPFGNTYVTGTSNGNEFQYTGRENEGNGLYFYRARYYSPLLGRFISEDPLGFVGSGPNFYAYAADDPIDFIDPLGLQSASTITGVSEAEIDAYIAWLEGQLGARGAGAGGVGAIAAGATATGAIIYYRVRLNQALDNETAAESQMMEAIHNLNQVLLSRGKRNFKFTRIDTPIAEPGTARGPSPLAGRYTAGGRNNDDECKREWKDAANFCSQLDDLRVNDPIEFRKWINIFGSNMLTCMKGQVTQGCGGNKV